MARKKTVREEPPKWIMPDWMIPLEEYFQNTGGNDIEDLVNRRDPHNIVWETLASCTESQVTLLYRLQKVGLLKLPIETGSKISDMPVWML